MSGLPHSLPSWLSFLLSSQAYWMLLVFSKRIMLVLSWLLSVFSLVLFIRAWMAVVVITISFSVSALSIFWSVIVITFSVVIKKGERKKKSAMKKENGNLWTCLFFFFPFPQFPLHSPPAKWLWNKWHFQASAHTGYPWVVAICFSFGRDVRKMVMRVVVRFLFLLSESFCSTSQEPPMGLAPWFCRRLCFLSATLCQHPPAWWSISLRPWASRLAPFWWAAASVCSTT